MFQLVQKGNLTTPIFFQMVSNQNGWAQYNESGGPLNKAHRKMPGGNWTNTTGTINWLGSGSYCYNPVAADVDTAGLLLFRFITTIGLAQEAVVPVQVVPWNPYDVKLGLVALPAVAPGAADGLLTRGAGAGQIEPSGGAIVALGVDVPGALTTAVLPEAYPPNGEPGTVAELLYLLLSLLGNVGVSGPIYQARQLDGVTVAAEYTLNDEVNPTERTRTD